MSPIHKLTHRLNTTKPQNHNTSDNTQLSAQDLSSGDFAEKTPQSIDVSRLFANAHKQLATTKTGLRSLIHWLRNSGNINVSHCGR